jgi:hypothetical protein
VGAAPVTALDQAALRFDRLVSIAESATAAAADAPSPDGYNWFRPWLAMLEGVRQQSQNLLDQPAAEQGLAQVSRAAEEQIAGVSERLETWRQQAREVIVTPELPPSLGARSSTKPRPAEQPAFSPESRTTYFVAEGGVDHLLVEIMPTQASPRKIQTFGLLAIAGLTLVGAWLSRSAVAADFLCRWPHAAGVAIGIAYWAWLWPSWLGLVIIAASLWSSFRFLWPGRPLRPEASTVLRSSRSL